MQGEVQDENQKEKIKHNENTWEVMESQIRRTVRGLLKSTCSEIEVLLWGVQGNFKIRHWVNQRQLTENSASPLSLKNWHFGTYAEIAKKLPTTETRGTRYWHRLTVWTTTGEIQWFLHLYIFCIFGDNQNIHKGDRQLALWLRVLITLATELGLVSSSYMVDYNHLQLRF